jgi:hypothetical protein
MKLLTAVGAVAVLAVALRAALPWLVKDYVNDRLAEIGEYRGDVEDVDLVLWRGGYVLNDVTIVKPTADVEPFLVMDRMDISLQWSALLDAELVGELVMHRPAVNLVQAETPDDTQLGAGVNWPAQVRDLFPFRFNHVEIRDGLVTFRAPGIEANESLTLRNLSAVLHNLTNVQGRGHTAFAEIELRGGVMGNAPLDISGRIDPNEELPTFDINLSLEGARLVDVNPWLEQFLNVDAERGAFSMFAELATSDGRFEGYIKPIMEDPEIFRANEPAGGPFQKAWEALVQLATKVFENRAEQQVATQIPFSGELEDPRADILSAAVNLLRNAFVAAFTHSLDGSISLEDVDPEADETSTEEQTEQQSE